MYLALLYLYTKLAIYLNFLKYIFPLLFFYCMRNLRFWRKKTNTNKKLSCKWGSSFILAEHSQYIMCIGSTITEAHTEYSTSLVQTSQVLCWIPLLCAEMCSLSSNSVTRGFYKPLFVCGAPFQLPSVLHLRLTSK